jgi:hypothetical protein
MFAAIAWIRGLFVALILALAVPCALATSPTPTHAQAVKHVTPDEGEPPGSPEYGILILIGIVAFLVLVAWLVARVGDDRGASSDGTIT